MDLSLLLACLAVLFSLMALVVSVREKGQQTTVDTTPSEAPAECAALQHDWPDHPYLIDGRVHFYRCRRGCGSQLRQMTPKGG